MRGALLLIVSIGAAIPAPASTLHARVASGPLVGRAIIIGRATCAGRVWLLTETPALLEIVPEAGRQRQHAVRGLRADDRPWGLGCAGGRLWMLASPHALVRLSAAGEIVERVPLFLPRLALFGAADRLVFEQLPIVVGASALTAGPARDPADVAPWPGLTARSAPDGPGQLLANLLNCGLGFDRWLACWFTDESQIAISDGVAVRRTPVALPPLPATGDEPAGPIHDVALVARHRLWVLAAVADRTRGQTGGRLLLVDESGVERAGLDLDPPARVILGASPGRCWLLTVDGRLMEVVER